MIDTLSIIDRFYEAGSDLSELLLLHSRQVAQLVQQLGERLVAQGKPLDLEFAVEAAMLHDIGVIHTNAPGIHCHGTEPYICHGVIGRRMLDEIVERDLPLPHRDLLPLSIEEKLVCYADKFFSKSHPYDPPRSLDVARSKLAKFGTATLARFDQMATLFGPPQ